MKTNIITEGNDLFNYVNHSITFYIIFLYDSIKSYQIFQFDSHNVFKRIEIELKFD